MKKFSLVLAIVIAASVLALSAGAIGGSLTYIYDNTAWNPSPINLNVSGETVGVRFAAAQQWYGITVYSPSYGDSVGGYTVTAYEWKGSYDATAASASVAEATVKDFEDNTYVTFDFKKSLPAGEYLVIMHDGADEGGSGAGIWVGDAAAGCEMYENGGIVDGRCPMAAIYADGGDNNGVSREPLSAGESKPAFEAPDYAPAATDGSAIGFVYVDSQVAEGSTALLTSGTINEYWSVCFICEKISDGLYRITDKKLGGEDKALTVPDGGIGVASNLGNNWPSLYASDPDAYAAYKDAPDYTSGKNAFWYTAAADSFAVGDYVSLTGYTEGSGAVISSDEYWTADFAAYTYITKTDAPAPETSEEPSEVPSEIPAESSEEPTPATAGGSAALALITAIASAAAAYIVIKRKNDR